MAKFDDEDAIVLSSESVSSRLADLDGWALQDNKLVKDFSFEDFVGAVRFVDRLTEVAEAQGHHPDLHVTWGKVTVELTSHVAGGVTDFDLRLAKALDGL
ncbi:MAG TPA: 4a-hydroxytetrahydrobiopterin dehydratase [Candidatus Dormibacteraeota bacterium]|jgi:4a-hydroxytetrahydrobiopterin dehydratase|nr:4a-hydroxytetrahydrobiopterin dehydratase [Candidatus Dormibacteraeota bacterium]